MWTLELQADKVCSLGDISVFFSGLSHHVVTDNGSLQMLIDKGNSNR